MANEKQVRRPPVIFLIFAAIIVYIIVVLITSFTGKKSTLVYEITRGSVSESLVVPGIILRDEKVFKSDESGYIEYYQSSGSKVKVGDIVYSVDRTGEASELIREYAGTGEAFSDEEKFQIHSLLSDFRSNYETIGFEGLYETKAGMSSILMNSVRDLVAEGENEESKVSGDSIKFVETDTAGYIVFASDGYEGLKADEITNDYFDPDKFQAKTTGIKKNIEAGETAYKLITSDGWSVLCKITPETVEEYGLKDKKAVTVNLTKAGTESRANFELIQKDDGLYALISMNKYVMNYARDRYADFEISSGETSGLQIPNSAIVTAEFIKIPRDYLTTGNNSKAEGFIVENGSGAVFQEIETEFKSTDHVFVKPGNLKEGTVLVMPDSDERYTVAETETVKGVYQVNSGYAVFKAIDVITENKEYSVLNETTSGVGLYDRILLNAGGYNEGDVVY